MTPAERIGGSRRNPSNQCLRIGDDPAPAQPLASAHADSAERHHPGGLRRAQPGGSVAPAAPVAAIGDRAGIDLPDDGR